MDAHVPAWLTLPVDLWKECLWFLSVSDCADLSAVSRTFHGFVHGDRRMSSCSISICKSEAQSRNRTMRRRGFMGSVNLTSAASNCAEAWSHLEAAFAPLTNGTDHKRDRIRPIEIDTDTDTDTDSDSNNVIISSARAIAIRGNSKNKSKNNGPTHRRRQTRTVHTGLRLSVVLYCPLHCDRLGKVAHALTSLSARVYKLTLAQVLVALRSASQLRQLVLQFDIMCPGFNNEQLHVLARQCPRLRVLSLTRNVWHEEQKPLWDGHGRLQTPHALPCFEDISARGILYLRPLPLERLCLSALFRCDDEFVDALSSLPRLRELGMVLIGVAGIGAHMFSLSAAGWDKLAQLPVRGSLLCDLGSMGAPELSALRAWKLHTLGVFATPNSQLELTRSWPTLTSLSLLHTFVTRPSVLHALISRTANLRHLSLQLNRSPTLLQVAVQTDLCSSTWLWDTLRSQARLPFHERERERQRLQRAVGGEDSSPAGDHERSRSRRQSNPNANPSPNPNRNRDPDLASGGNCKCRLHPRFPHLQNVDVWTTRFRGLNNGYLTRQLHTLELSSASDQHVPLIVRFNQLRTLRLDHAQITVHGLRMLQRELPQLRELDVFYARSNVRFSVLWPFGAWALAAAMADWSQHPSLERLRTNVHLSQHALHRFRQNRKRVCVMQTSIAEGLRRHRKQRRKLIWASGYYLGLGIGMVSVVSAFRVVDRFQAWLPARVGSFVTARSNIDVRPMLVTTVLASSTLWLVNKWNMFDASSLSWQNILANIM